MKKTADDGRIVITLKYRLSKQTRNQYPLPNRDATDCLRQMLVDYQDGGTTLAHLVASAHEIDVTVGK